MTLKPDNPVIGGVPLMSRGKYQSLHARHPDERLSQRNVIEVKKRTDAGISFDSIWTGQRREGEGFELMV